MSITIDLAILLLTTITILLLGIVVFARNVRSPVSQSFLIVTLVTASWVVSNYWADHAVTPTVIDFFTRAAFAAGALMAISIWIFSLVFPVYRLNKKLLWIITGVTLALTWLSAGSLVVEGVQKITGGIRITLGDFYWVYTAGLLVIVAATLYNLRQTYKTTNPLHRSQIKFIIFGVTVSAVLGIAANLVLPALVDDWSSSRFGPAALVFFVVPMSYAIIKQRLFDVRLAIARTLTYLLVLVTIGLFYAVIVFNAAKQFLDSSVADSDASVQIYYIAIALFIAVTFGPLKRFFSRITQRIFFRDSYDTKDVLDRLTSLLVGTLDIERLAHDGMKTLADAVRPHFIELALVDKQQITYRRAVGRTGLVGERVLHAVLTHRTSLLVTDETTGQDAHLAEQLYQGDIGLVVRLQNTRQVVGYLLFGYKQNGANFTDQDVRLIKTASDELAIAVQNAQRLQEIQSFNRTLQRKVDEATRQLRETNKKLRALDAVKDEFMSMASHQLRTPLTAVKGYLSMVLDGDTGPVKPAQRRLLGEAFASSQRMVYLIADFLNVSRIHTGKFALDARPTNLAAVIQGEIEQLKGAAKNRGLTLLYDPPAHFPSLMLDEDKLRQVIMNFIDNAIYYTPTGGTIEVTLLATDQRIILKVRDTGIGVPEREQHQLFTKFFRASNALKMRPDGTGIGLFLAKKVVIMHGGAILFESKPGIGSTFGFALPRAALLPEKKSE